MIKRLPYTPETFPMWAVWIREIEGIKFFRSSISFVGDVLILGDFYKIEYSSIDKYEISGTDGEWKPFYQEVEVCDNCKSIPLKNYSEDKVACTPKCKLSLEEKKKWEPEGGSYTINFNGDVLGGKYSDDCRKFGTQYKTKEQAQKASDQMRIFNLLLSRKMEECPDEGNCIIFKMEDGYKFEYYSQEELGVSEVSFTQEVAKQICKELNDDELNFLK